MARSFWQVVIRTPEPESNIQAGIMEVEEASSAAPIEGGGGSPIRPDDANSPSASPASGNAGAFQGVTAEDLPVDPPGRKHATLSAYAKQPVLRKLDWQTDEHGKPLREHLKSTTSLGAAYIQTRGTVATLPCTRCSQAKGLWKTCVVELTMKISSKGPQSAHGVCGNCRFAQYWNCEHRVGRWPNPMPDPASDDSAPGSRALRQSTRALRTRTAPKKDTLEITQFASTPNRPAPLPRLDEHIPDSPLPTPDTPGRASPHSKGEVIEFPLGSESLDDLPLLEQASRNLTQHLGKVNRRIQYLKEMERQKNIKSWDQVVDTIAIQFAKHLGLVVHATASARHHKYLKTLGAHSAFDYKDPGVLSQIVAAVKEDYNTLTDALFIAPGSLQSALDILKETKGDVPAKVGHASPLLDGAPTLGSVGLIFVLPP
ncbi:hypothetical protein BJX64DRAFT_283239 [Aspergillus heterothallicus]